MCLQIYLRLSFRPKSQKELPENKLFFINTYKIRTQSEEIQENLNVIKTALNLPHGEKQNYCTELFK